MVSNQFYGFIYSLWRKGNKVLFHQNNIEVVVEERASANRHFPMFFIQCRAKGYASPYFFVLEVKVSGTFIWPIWPNPRIEEPITTINRHNFLNYKTLSVVLARHQRRFARAKQSSI